MRHTEDSLQDLFEQLVLIFLQIRLRFLSEQFENQLVKYFHYLFIFKEGVGESTL